MRTLVLVTLVVLLAGVAEAEPGLRVPGLSIGAVAGTGGNPGMGGCLSYEFLRADNGSLFADLGVLVDGPTTEGFFGLSTDRRLPVLEYLPGDSCAGVGWVEPSGTWMLYLRYELF